MDNNKSEYQYEIVKNIKPSKVKKVIKKKKGNSENEER